MTRSGDLLAPHSFFARAAERVDRLVSEGDALFGDHHLNPDFVPPAGMRFREAAVLIAVVARPEPTVILTERRADLPSHPGQVAFPGGKIEPDDPDAIAAAIREAEEEIGLRPEFVAPIGTLEPYRTATGYRIVPVLARVEPGCSLVPDPREVADLFEVPLGFLMAPENHRRGSRVWNGRERYFYEITFEGRYIWGVTAGIIRALYRRVFLDAEADRL